MQIRFPFLLVLCLLSAMQSYAGSAAIHVTEAWVSEAPPTISINAAYLLIENRSDQSISLLKVDSPDFERIEMHRSVLSEGIARMQLQTQVDIAAKGQLQFAPGDYHLMLFNPHKRLRAGDFTVLTLYFSDGTQIAVDAEVKRLQPDHSHHH
jgi:periplasmic copper chaperone A